MVQTSTRPDTVRANRLDELGWARMQAGQYPAAEQAFQESLQLARQLRFVPGQIRAQLHLGENFWQQARMPEARQAVQRGSELARTAGRATDQLKALHRLATIDNAEGRYAQAVETAMQGLRLAERTRDTLRSTKFLSDLGDTYSAQGDFPRALRSYLESVRRLKLIGNDTGLGSDYASIGNVYQSQEQYRRSLPYYDLAIQTLRRAGDSSSVARCYVNAGVALRNLREYDQAARLFRKAEANFTALHQPVNVAAVLENLAILYLRQNQPARVIPLMDHSLRLLRPGGDQTLIVSALFNQAQAYYLLRNWAQAERYAQECLQLTQKIGILPDQYNAADLLSKLARQRGDFREALRFREVAVAAKDSTFNHEKSEALGRLQGDFDLSQERHRVQLLRKDQQLQEQRLRQQRWVVLGLTGGLLLVLGAGIGLWRVNRLLDQKNRKIEEQRALLEQLNRTKDRLFSIIGHDLRGPLHSLHAFVALLNLKQLPQEKLAQYSQRLDQTLNQVLGLIDNLLSWAAVQMQASDRVSPSAFPLQESVEENFRLLRTAAENKDLTLSSTLTGEETVWADADMVRLILRNLLSNAIKFTPAGGTIQVGATETAAGDWQVAVTDSGVGLTAEQLHALSQPTPPRSTVGTAQERGTGLGLVLVRDFVERNGGRLRVESAGPQQGTTVVFSLPRAAKLSVVA
ncbi:tetratricopeptide repeat protein [Hymenobacter sp. BT728]|nr:tetratricopeptide repeat protein [Hymenobacter pini]